MVGAKARLTSVSPVGKNSGTAGLWTNTQAFAESFAGESDAGRAARRRAEDVGAEVIGTGVATALTLLARTVNARAAVEIGTGTGVSASALLSGMDPDGVLTSIDPDADDQLVAREVLATAGIPARRARLITGQPLLVLPKLSDSAYDLVYVDGDPLEYVEYVAQGERLLHSGGIFVMHHALWGGLVADDRNEDDEPLIIREALVAVQESGAFTTALLPIGDGLLVAVRD